MSDWVFDCSEGALVRVLVKARSGVDFIEGVRDGRLVLRLSAAPVKNAANRSLVVFLSRRLKVSRSAIVLRSGFGSRRKTLLVKGVDAGAVRSLLGDLSG